MATILQPALTCMPATSQLARYAGPMGSIFLHLDTERVVPTRDGNWLPADDVVSWRQAVKGYPLDTWSRLARHPRGFDAYCRADEDLFMRPSEEDEHQKNLKKMLRLITAAREHDFIRGRMPEWGTLWDLLSEDENHATLNRMLKDIGSDVVVDSEDVKNAQRMFDVVYILSRRPEGIIREIVRFCERKALDLSRQGFSRLAEIFQGRVQQLKFFFPDFESGAGPLPNVHLMERVAMTRAHLCGGPSDEFIPTFRELGALAFYGLPEAIGAYVRLLEMGVRLYMPAEFDHESCLISRIYPDVSRLMHVQKNCEQSQSRLMERDGDANAAFFQQAQSFLGSMILMFLTAYVEVTCGPPGPDDRTSLRRNTLQVLAYLKSEILGKDHPFVEGLNDYARGLSVSGVS